MSEPTTQWLLDCWETMTLIRRTEENIGRLIESGEVRCPCHLCIGQEAVAAGVCAALAQRDTIWGGHRSHGHYLAKGGSLEGLFAEILLKTTGCAAGRGGSMHLCDAEAGIAGTVPIVAGTVPLAAGAAMAYKLRAEEAVAVAFFGDGALEEGQVHETLNLAALYRLPILFICENNQYASHMHWSERRRTDALYRAGEFHGVPGQQVDGNDATAVHQAAVEAIARARRGEGPTLIECLTFRWRGHVGASSDLDVGVKRRGELAQWTPRDPIALIAIRLAGLDVEDLAARESIIDQRIATALAAARSAPQPAAGGLEQFLWREAPCVH